MDDNEDTTAEQAMSIEVSCVVDAPVSVVFRFLSDPANHVALDTSGMLRGPATDALITGAGDVFVMNMQGDSQVANHVVTYEPDRAIGWAPAEPGQPPAGHTWTWRLDPEAGRTSVTEVYDWSRFTHLEALKYLPVINRTQMRESLDLLARALDRQET